MKTALLIVDIQNDYFPGGTMELAGSDAASLRAKAALDFFRDHRLPVIHIQHISTRPGATFFLPDTAGAGIHANVRPLAGESVFQKNFPNAFRNTPLLDHLKREQIGSLVIAGMMTSMCIDATVRAAFDHGFQNIVLHDACATRALSFDGRSVPAGQVHAAFLAALGAVYAKVIDVAALPAQIGKAAQNA